MKTIKSFAFYFVGISLGALSEKNIARHKLPPFLNWILFFGRFHKYTLNTIIYQSGVVIALVISLVLIIVFSGEVDKQSIVFNLYMKCLVVLFLMEAIFIIRAEILENRKNKKIKF